MKCLAVLGLALLAAPAIYPQTEAGKAATQGAPASAFGPAWQRRTQRGRALLGACVVMSRQRLCRYQQRLVVVTVGVAEPDLINGRRAVAEVGPVTLPKQAKRRRVRHVPAHAETGLIREAVYRFR